MGNHTCGQGRTTEEGRRLPPELETPWPYLQRNFGVSAESGNNTSNVLHSFDESGERVYKINVGMSDLVRNSEDNFFRMLYDLEVLVYMPTLPLHLVIVINYRLTICQGIPYLPGNGPRNHQLRRKRHEIHRPPPRSHHLPPPPPPPCLLRQPH